MNDYEKGYEYGYDEGYNDAECEHESDYSDGYNEGENYGYYSGLTMACMYYDDIEHAFAAAKKGHAWGALITAYDEYVYDIYDDDDSETRSELFWALVSYMSDDGATDEEYDLLYYAFGYDLYYLDDE